MPWIKAFVLGNGRSRLALDLNELKGRGTIYGCNALYREFTPDFLITTDQPMAREIEASGYPTHNKFYTRNPDAIAGSQKITLNFGYSSGPIAASMAAANEYHHPIYLIGFDFTGINGKINNVYAGTDCYRPADADETHYGNWLKQFSDIFTKQFPHKKFIRVVDEERYTPPEWHRIPNYSEVNFAEFKRSINNVSWQKPNE